MVTRSRVTNISQTDICLQWHEKGVDPPWVKMVDFGLPKGSNRLDCLGNINCFSQLVALIHFMIGNSQNKIHSSAGCYIYLGRGVILMTPKVKGDFIVEYPGELLSNSEAERKENAVYSTFRFFFFYSRKRYWLVKNDVAVCIIRILKTVI